MVEEPGTGHGVRLTLDADVQRACEALAAETMPRGCILVMDTATGELLASVSTPAFDPQNIAASIRADDTSLLNRPFCAFSAGSVFKVVLAAAAYEDGLDWFTHDCTGEIEVAGQTYRCAQGRAHGVVNLRGALEQSCNTYFVALGQLLGGEAIRAEAEKLGFGTAAQIAPGLKTAAGTLPEAEALQNPGELATFSFGQGALTVTPLQITAMMNTAAGGGVYKAPAFVQGITDADGTLTEPLTPAVPRTVLDKATARGAAQYAGIRCDGRHWQRGPARRGHGGRQDRHGPDRPVQCRGRGASQLLVQRLLPGGGPAIHDNDSAGRHFEAGDLQRSAVCAGDGNPACVGRRVSLRHCGEKVAFRSQFSPRYCTFEAKKLQ